MTVLIRNVMAVALLSVAPFAAMASSSDAAEASCFRCGINNPPFFNENNCGCYSASVGYTPAGATCVPKAGTCLRADRCSLSGTCF